MLDYDEHRVVEKELVRVDDCIPFKDAQTVTWINVDSVTEPGLLENFGRVMGFHSLMLEDILNTDQRPKFEDYGNYIYIVVKMLDYDVKKGEIEIEQLSLILGPNYVISSSGARWRFFRSAARTHTQIARTRAQARRRLSRLRDTRHHRGSLFRGAGEAGRENRAAGRNRDHQSAGSIRCAPSTRSSAR